MKSLSKNNAELKTLPLFLISLFGIVIVSVVFTNNGILKYIFLFAIFTSGSILTYKKYSNTYNIFYDEQYLTLKNIKKQRHIKFNYINRVKLTLADFRLAGEQYYEYKIDFENEIEIRESISFLVSNLNPDIWEFQDLIKLKSPKANIENHISRWHK